MNARVLIACSNKELLDVYQRFVSSIGLAVQTAAGGVECLQRLYTVLPNVVLLERELLWGGAEGVLAVMRDDPAMLSVPVVILLGENEPNSDAEQSLPPIVQCHNKPIRWDELANSVCSATSQQPDLISSQRRAHLDLAHQGQVASQEAKS